MRSGSVLLLLLVLPGCLLTRTLWHAASEPRATHIDAVVVACEVIEARGAAPPGSDGLWLRLAAEPHPRAPAYLQAASEAPTWVELIAPSTDTGGAWRTRPGAELFVPRQWGLRLTQGDYFQRAQPNARLWFTGSVARQDLGQMVPEDQVPAELRDAPPLPSLPSTSELERTCMQALRHHHWLALLGGSWLPMGRRHAEPIAWLDPSGQPLAAAPVERQHDGRLVPARPDVDRCSLLGRIDTGRGPRWVRVPVPVLAQGVDLELLALGRRALWQRDQIWRTAIGSPPPAEAPSLVAAAQLDTSVAFRFGREIEPSLWDRYAVATVLTPIAVALDVLVTTFPPLTRLMRYLLDIEHTEIEISPNRR